MCGSPLLLCAGKGAHAPVSALLSKVAPVAQLEEPDQGHQVHCVGLQVRSSAFHADQTGSIPVRSTSHLYFVL